MEMVQQWVRPAEFAAWLAAILTGVYFLAYACLRIAGVLMVTGGGWHAASWRLRGRVLLPALVLFSAFQPLLRHESAVRRRLSARGDEAAVSEVVVEVAGIV